MEKDDLEKLIRLSEVVRKMTTAINSVNPKNGTTLRGFEESYKVYREQVSHVVNRNTKYQLEFYATPRTINWPEVVSAYAALEGFLDSVVKQETVASAGQSDQLKKEFFIEENKPFTSHQIISDLLKKAVSELNIVDNFIESSSLDFLSVVNTKVAIKILSRELKPSQKSFKVSLGKFMTEWGGTSVEVKTTSYFHDRFIIVDNMEVWHVGPSLNRLGIKAGVISQMQDADLRDKIVSTFDNQWSKASAI